MHPNDSGNSPCGRSKASAYGFTLVELSIALLLVVTLAAWGLPAFQAFGHNTAIVSDTNRLQTAFSLARNTAITQRTPVTVCPANADRSACTSDWSNTLMVLRSDSTPPIQSANIVRVFPAKRGTSLSYSRGWRRITYNARGHTAGFNGHFKLCVGSDKGRKLVLSQLGRLRIDEMPIRC